MQKIYSFNLSKFNKLTKSLRLSKFICLFLLFSFPAFSQKVTQKVTLIGKLQHIDNQLFSYPIVTLKNTKFYVEADKNGNYMLNNVPFGTYTLFAFALGTETVEQEIIINEEKIKNGKITIPDIILKPLNKNLDEIEVYAQKEQTFGITQLKSVENFGIYEGKKTEVIVLKDLNANLSTNNPRQVYAKVTGLNIWESDGAGLQLGIGGRGLSPNRTSNFNTRQNGYDISADALGYPESYYTPPTEALERIEIIRGAASLQYGTQFGGMLNFRFKKGAKDKKIELTSRQSAGSWGFLGSFNSISGTVAKGKLNYYAYYQYKRGDGFRQNSQFDYHNIYASATYQISKKLSVNVDITKLVYLAQQAGGLTDKLFQENPQQSIRARNWFKVDWNLLAVNFTYNFSHKTQLNIRNFGLLARRQSLGNLERINVADFGANRTMIDGEFKNFGNETRLLHRYNIRNQHQTLLIGMRLYNGTTTAKQGDANKASTGQDADFQYLNPNNLENSNYSFPNQNYSFFAENIINLTDKFSLTPGVRWENIQTYSNGYYKQRVIDGAGNVIVDNKINENLSRNRNFLLFGLGASYKMNTKIEIYGNVSQNYRAINFTDLRIANPNFFVDPNIQDESGYTADLGIRGKLENVFTFEATVFYLKYNGRIGQVLRADKPPLYNDYRYRGNIADARNIGIELFGELDLLKITKKSQNKVNHQVNNQTENPYKWSIFGNFAFVDARYMNTDDASVKDKLVEMVPPIMFRTGSTFRYKNFATTLQFAYTAEQFSDATNAKRTATAVEGVIPAYKVMDLSASYTFNKKWSFLTIEGSINNLLNEMYFTRRAEAYPGPGIIPSDARGFYLTLQGKF
jgi:Fe(3+) dicitrate transport protein